MVALQEQDYEEAVKMFSQVIRRKSKMPFAYDNRGIAYTFMEQYKKGISDFSKTIQLGYYTPQTYYLRGICYIKTEQYNKAYKDLKTSAELFKQAGNHKVYKKIMDLLNNK